MLIYLILSILISLFLYYLVNRIEPFSMPYIPLKKRDLTEKPIKNFDSLITNPQKTYYSTLQSYRDYINLQRKIRNAFEDKQNNSGINPMVSKDLRWRIHRWSMWDYLPNLDNQYYCRFPQFNGKETCVPLSNRLYCSVSNLYKTASQCLNSLNHNKNTKTDSNEEDNK